MTWTGLIYRLRQGGARAGFAATVIQAFARLTVSRPPRIGLSAVVVGRNDDYMPDFAQRLRATIAWNLRWLADEIVFVEWNPLPDRPLLAPGLAREFPRVRAFVVDPHVHREVGGNAKVPVLEFHAKNAGIRRSSQEWILATNADALVGPDTVLRVRGRSLSPGAALTAQRIDIPWREQRSRPASVLDTLWYRRVIPDHSLGTGEFLLAHRAVVAPGRRLRRKFRTPPDRHRQARHGADHRDRGAGGSRWTGVSPGSPHVLHRGCSGPPRRVGRRRRRSLREPALVGSGGSPRDPSRGAGMGHPVTRER